MPRKAFLADLASISGSESIENITDISLGEDDGEFKFSFNIPGTTTSIGFAAIVPDLSLYPGSHQYHVFVTDERGPVPSVLSNAIRNLPTQDGVSVASMLAHLSPWLTRRARRSDHTGSHAADKVIDAAGSQDSHASDMEELDTGDEEDDDSEDWLMDGETNRTLLKRHAESLLFESDRHKHPKITCEHPTIRKDLRNAKLAGFKVGYLGNLSSSNDQNCFVSISVRISKLGVSDEAMEAWTLSGKDYLQLLIHYPDGYRSLEQILAKDVSSINRSLEMRVGLSSTYKPQSRQEALAIFDPRPAERQHPESSASASTKELSYGAFRRCFISEALNHLLSFRFFLMLKCRLKRNMPVGALEYLSDQELAGIEVGLIEPVRQAADLLPPDLPALSSIVVRDILADATDTEEMPPPLIAMQFLLKHFTMCTQYCLVCHRKVKYEIEAIKPYVCEQPLCLYQYMALGFGPNIEHEIVTQPFVIDLLVSLYYTSLYSPRTKDFPIGLGWKVPDPGMNIQGIPLIDDGDRAVGPPQSPFSPTAEEISGAKSTSLGTILADAATVPTFYGRLDKKHRELIVNVALSPRSSCRKGDWLVIDTGLPQQSAWSCRVIEACCYPTIQLSDPVLVNQQDKRSYQEMTERSPVGDTGSEAMIDVRFFVSNVDYDNSEWKNRSLMYLLTILPSVTEMREWILAQPGRRLGDWTNRMPPAALGLLRWIIASNRSCIMQVDQFSETEGTLTRLPTDMRIQGLTEWVQFKFAMGAPDKEQRFNKCVQSSSTNPDYPTLFAWHGSPLENWHSIIRDGLHFKTRLHGRSFGDGCYFSQNFSTSQCYTKGSSHFWPGSRLQITAVVALSELVNAPEKFRHSQNCYVVQHVDWIQTRYLCVRVSNDINFSPEQPLTKILMQDPERPVMGPMHDVIVLPESAIPKSRQGPTSNVSLKPDGPPLRKKMTTAFRGSTREASGEGLSRKDIDTESILTDEADRDMLLEHSVTPVPDHTMMSDGIRPKQPLEPVLSFTPRALEGLPLMPPPSHATSAATKRLQGDFRALLNTQKEHIQQNKLQELGWYVDPEQFAATSNLYQWIVELHSFPAQMPLSKDMKATGLQSILLEFRFNNTYPISPPFVRVIRPRFLTFQAGGGGHVTAGGSLCMELLTNSGWSAASDIESVLLQIRMAILSTDPVPARLQGCPSSNPPAKPGRGGDAPPTDAGVQSYRVGEAVEAFKRAARAHGWIVPEGLDQIAMSGS